MNQANNMPDWNTVMTSAMAGFNPTAIYAGAYNASPQAADLYKFVKTLEIYRKAIYSDTTLVLSTDSDLFQLLKKIPAVAA